MREKVRKVSMNSDFKKKLSDLIHKNTGVAVIFDGNSSEAGNVEISLSDTSFNKNDILKMFYDSITIKLFINVDEYDVAACIKTNRSSILEVYTGETYKDAAKNKLPDKHSNKQYVLFFIEHKNNQVKMREIREILKCFLDKCGPDTDLTWGIGFSDQNDKTQKSILVLGPKF